MKISTQNAGPQHPLVSARLAPSLSAVASDPVPERVSQPDESVSDAQREALDKQRAKWRRQKAAQRGKDPAAAEKRRAYYLMNRERILERQRQYYWDTWKLKVAGVIP